MQADSTGLIDTTYLDSATAVPGTAVFQAGLAYTPDGSLYTCPLPASDADYTYVAGFAVRNDGALCVAEAPAVAAYVRGVAVSEVGEVSIVDAVDGNFLGGLGITALGAWPVSDTGGGGGGGPYILLEDGFTILLETSGSLLLE